MPKLKSQVHKSNDKRADRGKSPKNKIGKHPGDYPYDYDFKSNHDFRERSSERQAKKSPERPKFPKLNHIPNRRGRQAARSEYFHKKGGRTVKLY